MIRSYTEFQAEPSSTATLDAIATSLEAIKNQKAPEAADTKAVSEKEAIDEAFTEHLQTIQDEMCNVCKVHIGNAFK
eukprot:4258172-Lingulodinium_polyedra.AAC.1